MLTPRSARCRQGQWTLVGTLVAVAIIIVLAALYIPRIARRHAEPGGAATPMERADAVACMSYQSQINQAISMYKMDHEGAPPRSVDDIKNSKYGVTDEMLRAPGCALVVPGGPGSGQTPASPSGAMPAPPAGSQRGPGGVAIPTIPGAGGTGDTGE